MCKTKFIAFTRWYDVLVKMPDDERLSVYDGIFRYVRDGVEPTLVSPSAAVCFAFIRQDIDATQAHYNEVCAKNTENARQRRVRQQEQREEVVPPPAPVAEPEGIKGDTFRVVDNGTIAKLWNTIVAVHGVPAVKDLEKRRPLIRQRLREAHVGYEQQAEWFTTLFKRIASSAFLTGHDGRWRATFDWLLRPGNILKVLEGNYDDRTSDSADIQTTTNINYEEGLW